MRTYTKNSSGAVKELLGRLADKQTDVVAYRAAMTELGKAMADAIEDEQSSDLHSASAICIACTVEDADFLARGLLEGLARHVDATKLSVACFWNERVRSFRDGERAFDVAPVIKSYREKRDLSGALFIVVKSIISGACVVKTNLATLLSDSSPAKVIVAAPVMFRGADEKLSDEFPAEVSRKFHYLTFAIDSERVGDEVRPGIGGMVYDRLGFEEKNRVVPMLVKERRKSYA